MARWSQSFLGTVVEGVAARGATHARGASSALSTLMKISRVVALAAHPISIASASAVTIALAGSRRRELGTRLGIALPLAVGTSKLLKQLAPRRKPRLLTVTPYESFPSGHSTAVAAAAASVIDGTGAWRLAPLALGTVAFVNACRVHDREHRISEVLAGDAIGLAAAAVAGLAARALERRRARARHGKESGTPT